MQSPLLQTKLFIPPSNSKLVPRPHLIQKLNEGLLRKLTLVSAPAGFGKTTLISSWINTKGDGEGHDDKLNRIHPSRVAWVSLDERDNDPVLFWNYIIAALQTVDATLGQTVQAILDTTHPPQLEALVTLLINELTEFQTDNQNPHILLLVLDDYHLIAAETIHNSLNFLLDHLPPFLHLVITTRSDPPLQLSSRRGRSEITQIRATDLSFTKDEAVEFFNTLMGLNLSEPDITALDSRTEGWVAGLQLAALSLQEQADKHTFVTDFAGSDHYIADYLVDEVLHHQPRHIQSFLLQTSILDQLCASLCNAVTGQDQSQKILTQLEQDNLFITPLDNRREWYRYHQLFADLLRQRLRESSNEADISRLHQQASLWYKERGDVIETVEHALLASDFQSVAQLIEIKAQEIFDQFRLNTLSKWVQTLPDDIVEARPKLRMIYAWALLATGHTNDVEYCLESIENGIDVSADTTISAQWEDLDPQVRGVLIEVTVVRSVIAINRFNIPKTIELCQQVLPFLNDDSQPHFFIPPMSLRTVVVLNMGLAYEFSGEVGPATEALTEAVTLSLQQKNNNILPMAIAHLGQLQILQGHLHQAYKTYRQALQLDTETTLRPSPMAGTAEIGLGNLYYEWNDLDRANHHLSAGINLANRWNHTESLLAGYIGLARIKQAQGEYSGAISILQDLEDLLQKLNAQILLPTVETCRVRIWIAQGSLAEATRWFQASNLALDSDLSFLQENDYLTLVRLLIAQEKWGEAEELINRILDFAETGERWGRIIELLLLQALVFNGQGKAEQALEVFLRTLTLAEAEGYMRLFLDEGHLISGLLYQAAATEFNTVYVNQLLQAFMADQLRDEIVGETETGSGSKLVEPLSVREVEVLHCIAEGLSNGEIAHRLTVSLSTVKSHTRNIYGKLGVNSRTRAVAQARAFGILPPG